MTEPNEHRELETERHRILVIDDEEEILYSLRNLLRHDFDVDTAESGQSALELLAERDYRVVMTDQRMPGMSGVEILQQVRSRQPNAIRLIFTGYADIKAVIDAINLGHVYRYVTKPWDPEELQLVLREACEHYERYLARRETLKRLRDCQEQYLALLDGLHAGRLGSLNEFGRAEVERLSSTGRALRDSIDAADV